jgi:hypothetical protein
VKKTVKVIAIAVVVCIIPLPHMVAPRWAVTVVDESNNPVGGITVRESSQDYSIESVSHEVDLKSGGDGRVVFPTRIILAPVVQRIVGVVANVCETGVHASFGTHTWVLAFGSGLEGYSPDWHGFARSMNTVIVVHPQTVPIP